MLAVVAVTLLLSRAIEADVDTSSTNIALRTLSEYYATNFQQNSASDLCSTYSCCSVPSSENGCSITDMKRDASTLVFPGGETRCIYSYSTPFSFEVIPGDNDKVLLFFQSGGACWDRISNKEHMCLSDVRPTPIQGVFLRDQSINAFAKFTVIHISYCSGDVFGGNITQSYNDDNGQPIVQRGYLNAQSAVDWLLAQQSAKSLATTLSELIIMGSSAGSLGAQLWASKVLKSVRHKKALVIPDSYAGVLPPGTVGPLVTSFGACHTDLFSPLLKKKCLSGDLTFQDVTLEALTTHPDVPFAFIQSKIDHIQELFYVALGVTLNSTRKATIPAVFYAEVNALFGLYNRQSNFVSYLVNGDHHVFAETAGYYQSDAIGYEDGNSEQNNGTIMLSEWLNQLVQLQLEGTTPSVVESVCLGDLLSPHPRVQGEDPSQAEEEEGGDLQSAESRNDYCTSLVIPKTLFV